MNSTMLTRSSCF